VTGNYDINNTTLLWGSQHPDREYMVIHSSNAKPEGEYAINITRLVNGDLDAALDEARTTEDAAVQREQWGEVQEALAEENNFVFLVHVDIGEAATREVQDVQKWTFPDGTPGRPQEQTLLSLYQIWLTQ
jgi:ABC-type transport system substrate-binding protein